MIDRVCSRCGRPFSPNTTWQRFCHARCRVGEFLKQKRAEKKRLREEAKA